MISTKESAAQFTRISRIYQSYFSPALHNRIFGIAYNVGHVEERDKVQVWFDKPLSSVIFDKEPLKLPNSFDKVFHEVELGVVLGMQGKNIHPDDVKKHISGYFLAIDFTNRGLGAQFKKDGAPWCLQKGSDGFTAVSDFIEP